MCSVMLPCVLRLIWFMVKCVPEARLSLGLCVVLWVIILTLLPVLIVHLLKLILCSVLSLFRLQVPIIFCCSKRLTLMLNVRFLITLTLNLINMAKFRTQYSEPVKMGSIDNSNMHHETIPGQAKTGAQLWTMRNAGLPLNATVNFNDVDPRADFFDNLDAMQSFMLRHGLYTHIETSPVEKPEEQSPAEVPVSE